MGLALAGYGVLPRARQSRASVSVRSVPIPSVHPVRSPIPSAGVEPVRL